MARAAKKKQVNPSKNISISLEKKSIQTKNKLPENKDKAAVFYSKPVAKGASGGHYGGDHDTYMKVGEGMGKLMIELLSK